MSTTHFGASVATRWKHAGLFVATGGLLLFLACQARAQSPAPSAPANPSGVAASEVRPDANGQRPRGRLGVTLKDNANGTVWIESVEADSAADKAGLRVNDQIVALDDRPIQSHQDVVRYIQSKHVSDDVTVDIRRNGKVGMLTASLGAGPMATTANRGSAAPGAQTTGAPPRARYSVPPQVYSPPPTYTPAPPPVYYAPYEPAPRHRDALGGLPGW